MEKTTNNGIFSPSHVSLAVLTMQKERGDSSTQMEPKASSRLWNSYFYTTLKSQIHRLIRKNISLLSDFNRGNVKICFVLISVNTVRNRSHHPEAVGVTKNVKSFHKMSHNDGESRVMLFCFQTKTLILGSKIRRLNLNLEEGGKKTQS